MVSTSFSSLTKDWEERSLFSIAAKIQIIEIASEYLFAC
jgi:hypothetical protein